MIRLFGDFEVIVDGHELALAGTKDRALLAFLALNADIDHPRERLAGLLWGESEESRARDSLKHSLQRLRGALSPKDVIVASRNSVRLRSGGVAIDVAEFERLAARNLDTDLKRILELYRGDLLAAFVSSGSGFDDWLMEERERFHRIAENAALRNLALQKAAGTANAVVEAAQQVVRLDPTNEKAWRSIISAQADQGNANQALKTFESLKARLRADLDILPEAETVRLAEEIRSGKTQQIFRESGKPPLGAPIAIAGSRPSIAVLPFDNLGGAADQDYFSDGIVEEIITALSRLRGLFVIARNSSFAFKGRSADTGQVGSALGVRYLVHGSMRRHDDQVRVTATLVDVSSGNLLWSDNFQDNMSGLFELQDKIAGRIVGALLPRMEKAEIDRAFSKPTGNLDAYDYYLRGLAFMHEWSRQGNASAIEMFGQATNHDPKFAAAYGMAIRCYSQRKACGWVTNRESDVAETARLVREAVNWGADDAQALATAGIGVGFVIGKPAEGIRYLDMAIRLNPNLSMAWLFSSWVHVWLGQQETAKEHARRAMLISPHDPQIAMMQTAIASAFFFSGEPAEAVGWAEKVVIVQPTYWIAWCVLAASRAASGDRDGAKEALAQVRKIDPELRQRNLMSAFPIQNPDNIRLWTSALSDAGLPR